MGLQNCVAFALYKPIADDIESENVSRILYKWFYRGVAAFVAIAGLLVIPFMDKPDIDNLTYILSAFYVQHRYIIHTHYKKTLIEAHQVMYISTLARTLSWIIQDIGLTIVLLSTKNFILFFVCLYTMYISVKFIYL